MRHIGRDSDPHWGSEHASCALLLGGVRCTVAHSCHLGYWKSMVFLLSSQAVCICAVIVSFSMLPCHRPCV
jgi:hypothetical protein